MSPIGASQPCQLRRPMSAAAGPRSELNADVAFGPFMTPKLTLKVVGSSAPSRLLLCRFLDAGMTRLYTRSCGRRPKSAKARNRGRCAKAVPRTLWGFCRGFGLTEVGLKWLPRLACGEPWSHG